jgi:hypothetical protein
LAQYWSGVRICSRIAPSWYSRLHLAQPALDRLQPLAHQRERLAQPPLERPVQTLVHRHPHLFELPLVPVP